MILKIIFLILFSSIIYLISVKNKFFLDVVNISSHKVFVENKKNTPLVGGLIVFFSILLFIDLDVFKLIALTLIIFLGIFSDLNIISNASKRFLIQFIIIFFFFYFSEIKIVDTRIEVLNNLLSIPLFSLIFCSFCVMILINGFNFIDGLNGLALGYFMILLTNIIFLSNIFYETSIFLNNFNFIIIQLLILLFILSGVFFLGDSGSYLIGFILGIQIISINFYQPFISPYYLILLIWYPCFEVLFSFLRKSMFKKSPFEPDTNHLHQLLYLKLKNTLKPLYANSSASIIILLYNLIVILYAKKFLFDSTICILILFMNVIIYLLSYYLLNKKSV